MTTATSMHSANDRKYLELMERMPGRPPTPMAFAAVEVAVQMTPATAEPIMAHTNGKTYFRLTPNMAGSVTPR